MKHFLFIVLLTTIAISAKAQKPTQASDCDEMSVWNYEMSMCMPLAMKNMPMRMLMLEGNGFLVQTAEEGPRAHDVGAAPNMIMADLGTSVGDNHYVNLDVMATAELWTYPAEGYPELLQIGEQDSNHKPFVDSQHPHSSPIMGLTFSDTITLQKNKDHVKVWIAPRSDSTDGPVAFMHRPTGMVNPDAPLGHHIGQDVGHISSSVIGASLHLGDTTYELSAFNGTEPDPTATDLPLKSPNSYAARVIYQVNDNLYGMGSAAFVKDPEPEDKTLDHVWRYSISFYGRHKAERDWTQHDTFIWGLINGYDHTAALNSFAEEFSLDRGQEHLWGRIEVLQRTAGELLIVRPDANEAHWVTAVTLGFTQDIAYCGDATLSAGASATLDFLPAEFQTAYGGTNPLSGRVFLQASGMKMWNL